MCAAEKKKFKTIFPESIVKTAENAVDGVVKTNQNKKHDFDRKLDKLFTSKLTGIPIMLLLLLLIFWITAVGANYPSELLQRASGFLTQKAYATFDKCQSFCVAARNACKRNV